VEESIYLEQDNFFFTVSFVILVIPAASLINASVKKVD
jgi:hypothetical protein